MVTNRQQESLYTVTNRQVIAFLAAIVVLAASYIGNIILIDDPEEVKRLRDKLRELEQVIREIRRDDVECAEDNEQQEVRLKALETYRLEHTRWGYEQLQKDEKRMSTMEAQIQQFIEHIRNDRPYYYPRGSGVLDTPNGKGRQHSFASQ